MLIQKVFLEEIIGHLGERPIDLRNALLIVGVAIEFEQAHQIARITVAQAVTRPKALFPQMTLAALGILRKDRSGVGVQHGAHLNQPPSGNENSAIAVAPLDGGQRLRVFS